MKFFTYGWQLVTDSGYGGQHVIAWALTEQNETACLHFTGYKDTMIVGLPEYIGMTKLTWDEGNKNKIKQAVREALGDGDQPTDPPIFGRVNGEPVYFREVNGQYLHYFQTNDARFLKFKIPDTSYREKIKKVLCNKGIYINGSNIKLVVYDDEASLILKFITEKNLNYCDWIECEEVVPVKDEFTTCLNYKVSNAKVTFTTGNGMGNPKILAFDLECNSKRFQLPIASRIDDYIGMVSLVHGLLGDENPTKEIITIFPPNPIPGVIVRVCKSERELLEKFRQRMKEIDPHWICGHNIDGFDTPYLKTRFGIYNIPFDFSKMYRYRFMPKFIKGSMNGRFRDGYVFDAPGIMSKDTLKSAQGKLRLRHNDLDSVLTHVFGRDSEYKKMDIGGFKQIFRALQEYNPNDKKSVKHITKITEYCVDDAKGCYGIYNKFAIHYDDCSMANASQVPIDILNTRGQMIRSKSQIYRIAKNSKPEIMLVPRGANNESFTGGSVSTPETGLWEDVITLDFNSLYPSIIIAYNICYHTLINPDLYNIIDNDPKLKAQWGDPYDKYTNPTGKYHKILCPEEDKVYEYRFVTKEFSNNQGILPRNAAHLIATRKVAKKEMEKHPKGSIEYVLADAKQNALKIVNNSAYGFLKAPGNWSSIECARSVTAKGRESKLLVEKILRDKYNADIIYGDTDSVMFRLRGCKTTKEAYEAGKRLEKEISDMMMDGLVLEMEKTGRILSLKPKHYIYWEYDYNKGYYKLNNDKLPEYLIRGVVSTKRDRCLSHINVYTGVYDRIMQGPGVKDSSGRNTYSKKDNASNVLNYLWQSAVDIYFGARGKVEVDEKGHPQQVMKLEYQHDSEGNAILDEKGNPKIALDKNGNHKLLGDGKIPELIYDANGQPLVVAPCAWSDMEMTFKMGENYDNENFHLSVLSERLKAEGRPIEVGDRFGALLKKADHIKNVGAKTITTNEFEEYLRDLDQYIAGKRDIEPSKIEIDKLYYLERKMAATTDLLIEVAFKDLIVQASDEVHKKIIRNIFTKLYVKYGQDLIIALEGREDPMVAVYTCDNPEMAADLKTLYTRYVINRRTVNYGLSNSVMGNCVKHLIKRNLVMKDICIFERSTLITVDDAHVDYNELVSRL